MKNGKKQLDQREISEGTNIGRSNERTCDEQAEFEAESKWKRQQNYKGYVTNLKLENKKELLRKGKDKGLAGMKATTFSDKLMKTIGFPCYVQPKLDGVYCVIENNKIFSFGGIEYVGFTNQINIIKRMGLLKDGESVAGELYCHGMALKEISGIARNTKDFSKKHLLKVVIFDCITIDDFGLEDSYQDKMKVLKSRYTESNFVQIIPTFLVNNKEQLDKKYRDFVLDHYEGLMVRKIDMSFYQSKSSSDRSKEILKVKDFKDEEFDILYPIEGKGRSSGTVGSFKCRTKNGASFDCSIKGTQEYRAELLRTPSLWQGKKLKVRYLQMWDGVPQIPVGIHIRPEGE